MLNSTTSYSILKGMFTAEECEQIIELGKQGRKDPGFIGDDSIHEIDKSIRDTELYFFNNEQIFQKLQPIINSANQNNNWNFELAHMESLQLTVYQQDGHYNWHVDSHPEPYKDNGPLSNMVRKISFSLILNNEFQGGEFEFANPIPTQSNSIVSNLAQGDILIFPSYTAHKVNAVTQGQRYSLVGWICGYPWR